MEKFPEIKTIQHFDPEQNHLVDLWYDRSSSVWMSETNLLKCLIIQ